MALMSGMASVPPQAASPTERAGSTHRLHAGTGKLPAGGRAAASLATLVAIGAIEDDRERRRRQADGLFQGLDLLEQLHRELASGSVPAARLDQLAEWLATAEEPAHPRLADMMRDIALRLAIELAKLGR
jgi:hypothetical protein